MKGTGAGWDTLLYRIGIIAGLAGIVFAAVVSAYFLEGRWQWGLTFGCITLFILVFLLYWWWQILFEGYGALARLAEEPPAGVPELSALKSKDGLWKALSLQGGDPAALLQAQRSSRRGLVAWFGFANVIWLAPIAFIWLNLFEIVEADSTLVFVLGFLGLVLAMILFSLFLMDRLMTVNEAAYVAPLGLEITALPGQDRPFSFSGEQIIPAGATVMRGARRGRQTCVAVGTGSSMVWLSAALPNFAIRSEEGKLLPEGAIPQGVQQALKGMRKAKRWKGIAVRGGPDGLLIERPGTSAHAWLYDLWLAERILQHF